MKPRSRRWVVAGLELGAVAALVVAAWFGAVASLHAGATAGAEPRAAEKREGGTPLAPRRQVAVLIFEGVQIIDFAGPYEVFGQAGYDTFTVAEKPGPITTSMGLTVVPRYSFASSPAPDVLVIPGGNVASVEESAPAMAWVRTTAGRAPIVLSVCNGAFILAQAGLLDGLEATTFAALIDELAKVAPKTRVVRDKRFVDNGRIITSAGLSSGLDGALHVIERLDGLGTAQGAATGLEYNWDRAGTYVRAALADRYLRPAFSFMHTLPRHLLSYEGTTDRWEARYRVDSDAPAAELLAGIETALTAGGRWQPPAEGGDTGGSTPRQGQGGSAGGAVGGRGGGGGGGLAASATPQADGGGGGRETGVTRRWRFSDERGRAWRGMARVEPAPGAAPAQLITLRVQLGAG
jgi:putative intracellular protease/amidase